MLQKNPRLEDLSAEERECVITGIMDEFNVSREEAEKNWEIYTQYEE